MIQVAILVVLLLILIMLAPWLVPLLASLFAVVVSAASEAVAAYGVVVVGIGIAMVVVVFTCAVLGFVSGVRRQKPSNEAPPIAGDRITCPHCQAEISSHLSRCDNCRKPIRE